jgi:hypothetical protein
MQRIVNIFIALLMINTGFSQEKKNVAGVKLHAERFSIPVLLPGLVYERRISNKHSIEATAGFRCFLDSNLKRTYAYGSNFTGEVQYTVQLSFKTIGVAYKYKAKHFSCAIGPTIDIYTGWRFYYMQSSPPNSGPNLNEYRFDKKTLWGAHIKISKPVSLKKIILFEPEIYWNPVFTQYSSYSKSYSDTKQFIGIGLDIKFPF